MKREESWRALFEQLQTQLTSAVTFERKLRHWDDVGAADMPYVGLTQGTQTSLKRSGIPYAWHYRGKIYIYNRAEDDGSPVILQNQLLDELEECLAPDPVLQKLNLGKNFIDDCRIDGDIDTDEGLLGDLAIAIVPILLIVTK